MRISLEWLKDYISVDLDVQEIADRLTMAGLEVESIDFRKFDLKDVITARIEKVEEHPEADKLNICILSANDRKYTVVCGDKKVMPGDLVAFALPGVELPDGRTIERSRIRGIASDGMLCSEKELGITEESFGVMILPDNIPPGKAIVEVISETSPRIEIETGHTIKRRSSLSGYSDSIFEVGLTPNRPDCLSIFGLARELSALTGKEAHFPEIKVEEQGTAVEDEIEVDIKEAELCNRYTARVIKGVAIGRSPLWLRKRIESAGIRSINNVVDVTNYVMLELGQPLHAFDLAKIRGRKIVVRKAGMGEQLTTLDGIDRVFSGDELLICDEGKPLAIAGIMGGLESGVTEGTCDILLESAYFSPFAIRKTARRMGIHTESSHRFERGVDPGNTKTALERMVELIRQVAGGEIAEGVVDVNPVKYVEKKILLRADRCSRILGMDISESEIITILEALNMKVSRSDDVLAVSPPSYRVDIEREIDLVEEVARIKGYSAIGEANLSGAMPSIRTDSSKYDISLLKRFMADSGYGEVINYSFQSPKELDNLRLSQSDPLRKTVDILNPISQDLSRMRTTLIPGLMKTAAFNIKKQGRDLMLFEVGKVFAKEDGNFKEGLRLAALITGDKNKPLWKSGTDIYDLKGTMENLLALLDVKDYTFSTISDIPFFHPGRGALAFTEKKQIGLLGEIHPLVCGSYGIEQKASVFEIDLDVIKNVPKAIASFRDIPVYPYVERDVSFLVDKAASYSDISKKLNNIQNPFIETMDVFDQFEGEGIENGKKSLSVRFRYRSFEKTLTDIEVNEIHESVVTRLVKDLGARIR